jgi:L-threonylcarbamoyladenylate synthase
MACGISALNRDAVSIAVSVLRSGGVVAIPTDTVYGFAAAIDQEAAIDRLFALKGRDPAKAIPILLSDLNQWSLVARKMPAAGWALARHFWPGALTLVLEALDNVPAKLTADEPVGLRTVAVRVPDHDLARAIIASAGGALAVTSANRSGEAPALDAGEIDRVAARAPDAIVDAGRVRRGVPSTIVRVFNDDAEILRQGPISAADITKVTAALF